jgi:hypothetical protein
MRTFLAAAALLLAVAGCDSTAPGERNPDPELVGVQVTYRLSVVGESSDVAVVYTNADGSAQNDLATFSRQTSYTQAVVLEPGATGTFSISGTGLVSSGRLAASVVVTRVDTGAEVGSDTDVVTTSSSSEEATAMASVNVVPVIAEPDTAN